MRIQLNSDDINVLIYRYLVESGFQHTAFCFQNEANVGKSVDPLTKSVPPGALISFMQKALMYIYIESHIDENGVETKCSEPLSLFKKHECKDESGLTEKILSDDQLDNITEAAKEATRLRYEIHDMLNQRRRKLEALRAAPIVPATIPTGLLDSSNGNVVHAPSRQTIVSPSVCFPEASSTVPASIIPSFQSNKNEGKFLISDCRWSPIDASAVSASDDGLIRLWQLQFSTTSNNNNNNQQQQTSTFETLKAVKSMSYPRPNTTPLFPGWLPSGLAVYAAGADGSLAVWDRAGSLIAITEIEDHAHDLSNSSIPLCVVANSDGRSMAMLCDDASISVHQIPSDMSTSSSSSTAATKIKTSRHRLENVNLVAPIVSWVDSHTLVVAVQTPSPSSATTTTAEETKWEIRLIRFNFNNNSSLVACVGTLPGDTPVTAISSYILPSNNAVLVVGDANGDLRLCRLQTLPTEEASLASSFVSIAQWSIQGTLPLGGGGITLFSWSGNAASVVCAGLRDGTVVHINVDASSTSGGNGGADASEISLKPEIANIFIPANLGSAGEVTSIQFAPRSASVIAVTSEARLARVIDLASGGERLVDVGSAAHSVSWDALGSRLVICTHPHLTQGSGIDESRLLLCQPFLQSSNRVKANIGSAGNSGNGENNMTSNNHASVSLHDQKRGEQQGADGSSMNGMSGQNREQGGGADFDEEMI